MCAVWYCCSFISIKALEAYKNRNKIDLVLTDVSVDVQFWSIKIKLIYNKETTVNFFYNIE